jgi:hypothetical protein
MARPIIHPPRVSTTDAFLSALSEITGTGSFYAAGAVPFFLPELHIEGVGEIGFPLPAAQAKEIIALAEAAPFGRGSSTVYDESVRKCWQIDAACFKFRSPAWKKFLRGTLDHIQETLGIRGKTSATPYKFLLYGKGGHFKAHKDTEKLDSMFGTLVIALPSQHEGGRLFIRHDGREFEVDFSAPATSRDLQYAAFFADCEHEVEPVRSGYRCCVVYNLRLDEGDPALLNLSLTDQARTLLPALAALKPDLAGDLGVVLLEHAYTEANLSIPNLKGNDQARAQALFAAAAETGLIAHLALVTLHQSGALEEYDYDRHHRRGRHYEDDDDPTDGSMGEIYDESLCVSDWRNARNQKCELGVYHLEPDQLITRESLTDEDPDEKEAEGYTGNAGCTMDYWYRRAAIVLWDSDAGDAVRCRYNLRGACDLLESLAGAKKTGPGSPFHRLASAAVERYPEVLPHFGPYSHHRDFSHDPLHSLLAALAAAKAMDLLGELLEKLPTAAWIMVDAGLWDKLHQAFGSARFEPIQNALFAETAALQRRPLFQVLASLATQSDGAARAQAIAAKLAPLGPAEPSRHYQEGRDPLSVGDCEEARAMLAASHHVTGAKERKAVRGFLEADASVPYVRRVLGPALMDKSMVAAFKRPGSLAPELLEFAIGVLASEVARPLPPYPDWTRPCPELKEPGAPAFSSFRSAPAKRPDPIAELVGFMADPNAKSHSFARPEAERSRIELFIRQHFLDVDFTTIRKGSPHTLACTKNDASHQHALALRGKDRDLLKSLTKLRR